LELTEAQDKSQHAQSVSRVPGSTSTDCLIHFPIVAARRSDIATLKIRIISLRSQGLANRYTDAPNPDCQQLAVDCKGAMREFSRELRLASGRIQADQTAL